MLLRKGILIALIALAPSVMLTAADKTKKPAEPSPLDRYVQEALSRPKPETQLSSPGSLWSPASRLTELGSDIRASQIDDLITILVAESASAVAQGTTKTQRQSSAKSSVNALGGVTRATGPWANLANLSTTTQLDGQGATTRSTQLNTTLSARITNVLPNGYL